MDSREVSKEIIEDCAKDLGVPFAKAVQVLCYHQLSGLRHEVEELKNLIEDSFVSDEATNEFLTPSHEEVALLNEVVEEKVSFELSSVVPQEVLDSLTPEHTVELYNLENTLRTYDSPLKDGVSLPNPPLPPPYKDKKKGFFSRLFG